MKKTIKYIFNDKKDNSVEVLSGIYTAFPCKINIHCLDDDNYEAFITDTTEHIDLIEKRIKEKTGLDIYTKI